MVAASTTEACGPPSATTRSGMKPLDFAGDSQSERVTAADGAEPEEIERAVSEIPRGVTGEIDLPALVLLAAKAFVVGAIQVDDCRSVDPHVPARRRDSVFPAGRVRRSSAPLRSRRLADRRNGCAVGALMRQTFISTPPGTEFRGRGHPSRSA